MNQRQNQRHSDEALLRCRGRLFTAMAAAHLSPEEIENREHEAITAYCPPASKSSIMFVWIGGFADENAPRKRSTLLGVIECH